MCPGSRYIAYCVFMLYIDVFIDVLYMWIIRCTYLYCAHERIYILFAILPIFASLNTFILLIISHLYRFIKVIL